MLRQEGLNLANESIETYKARAMDKLAFHSRIELVGKGLLAGNMRLNSLETKLGARRKTASEKQRNRIL